MLLKLEHTIPSSADLLKCRFGVCRWKFCISNKLPGLLILPQGPHFEQQVSMSHHGLWNTKTIAVRKVWQVWNVLKGYTDFILDNIVSLHLVTVTWPGNFHFRSWSPEVPTSQDPSNDLWPQYAWGQGHSCPVKSLTGDLPTGQGRKNTVFPSSPSVENN